MPNEQRFYRTRIELIERINYYY